MTTEHDGARFASARRGYERAQVDEHVARLEAELSAVAANRDRSAEQARMLARQLDASRGETQAAIAAGAQARGQLNEARVQIAGLSTVPHTVDGMSERLQQMVRVAQDEVHDMRSRATVNATHVLSLAQAEADELRERCEKERREFESDRTKVQETLRVQLEESQERLDMLRRDSDGQKARFETELAERRAQAEHALSAEVQQRRTAVMSDLANQQSARAGEAARIVEAAGMEARRLVAEATVAAERVQTDVRAEIAVAQRELDALRTLQHQISEQLTSVRALLDWTLPKIVATDPRPPAKDPPPVPPDLDGELIGLDTPVRDESVVVLPAPVADVRPVGSAQHRADARPRPAGPPQGARVPMGNGSAAVLQR